MSMDLEGVFGAVKDTLIEYMDCILVMDLRNDTYHAIRIGDDWKEKIQETGSLKDLFFNLYMYGKHGTTKGSAYGAFATENLFKKVRYQGRIDYDFDGEIRTFGTTVLRMKDERSALFIYRIEDNETSDKIENEKIDAIQENFLFSMMVDLTEDSCINPNTTEVSAKRQDYLEIKYSDWRMTIVNMFKEMDRDYFLRMTSPEYILNTLEVKHNFEFELQMLNMQGKYIWVRLNFTRLKGFSREYPRFVYTVKDVEADMERLLRQNSIVKAVEEQNAKLIDAEKNRTRYFSNLSHEIRTPINAILGMNEVILRESTEDNIKAYAMDVKSSSRFLLSIVNDILDVSKIQAGKMEIVPKEYNLDDMVKEINTLIISRIGEKNLEFVTRVGDDIPKNLYGDDIRITQIVINLLTNAVKYTPSGKVEFIVESARTKEDTFAIKVVVRDTGVGIRQEDMERLFGEYERIESAENRKIEGTGLGMSIVTGLLEQMGSKLEVKSEYGKGSEFSFILPQKEVIRGEEASKGITTFDVSDKCVLVVDDNGINLKVARALLKPYKMKVDLANSGRMCLDKISDNQYDMIFLDHMMPEMDGIETLNEIRAAGGAYEKLPVIALTANLAPDARDQYVGLGFTDYLEKPITTGNLHRVVKTYLARI